MNKTAGRDGPDEIRRAKLIVNEARESEGVVLPEPTTPGEAALIGKEYEFGARGLALNHQAFPWAILGEVPAAAMRGPIPWWRTAISTTYGSILMSSRPRLAGLDFRRLKYSWTLARCAILDALSISKSISARRI